MLKMGLAWLCFTFCIVAVTLSGCGGGGGESPSGSPVLQSSLMTYSFGDVTLDNFPAAKEITLSNSGDAPLKISNIALAGAGFILDLASGANFCGSTTPTIAVGDSCAIAVGFGPTTVGSYSGTLSVSSNYPSPMDIGFTGTGVSVSVPTVQINRVEPDACSSSELSIYLSVMDQLGYPIYGLPSPSFTISETFNGSEFPMVIKGQANVSASISVALAMDYSGSITNYPEVQEAMEAGVVSFINGLGFDDEAEIIKFDSYFEVVQQFTAGNDAGKADLIAAVLEPWDMGRGTRLYDTIYRAVADLALTSTDRKILIVLSDGFDGIMEGDDPVEHSFAEVKNYAIDAGVHVFTVGIAPNLAGLKGEVLDSLASETGGQYLDTLVADDLNTIYQQLKQIVFVDQYLLTYNSVFESGESALLKVGVTVNGITGEDSREIIPCP